MKELIKIFFNKIIIKNYQIYRIQMPNLLYQKKKIEFWNRNRKMMFLYRNLNKVLKLKENLKMFIKKIKWRMNS